MIVTIDCYYRGGHRCDEDDHLSDFLPFGFFLPGSFHPVLNYLIFLVWLTSCSPTEWEYCLGFVFHTELLL